MPDTNDLPLTSSAISAEPATTAPDLVTNTLNLTETINSFLTQVDRLKEEVGKYKDMLDSIYENDPTYQQHDAAVREATKIRSATKKQIQKMPQAADLANKVVDMRQQIKDLNTDLSEVLQQYEKATGLRQIESSDGQIRQIIYTARLVKKNDFNP